MSGGLGAYRIGRSDMGEMLKTTQKFKSGTSYVGRRGIASMMDGHLRKKEIDDYDAKYGGNGTGNRGVYALKLMTPDGKGAAAHGILNIGGKRFTADNDGNLRILDAGYIKEEVLATKAQRDYEESIVESVLVSDEMAMHVLGAVSYAYLAAGAGPKDTSGDILSATLVAVDAHPSVIRYLDPTSAEYARAIAKIRAIVHLAGIIVNEESEHLPAAGTLASAKRSSSHDA